MNIIKLIFLTPILLLINGCSSECSLNTGTYFGGQIINPKCNTITLLKDGESIKTIKLDENNSFLVKLDSIEEGLYTFMHGAEDRSKEFQYIYIEPNDSLLIRLNTWDFDESLVYSGRGAAKNNFIVSMYLLYEENEKNFQSYYSLEVDYFEEKIRETREKSLQIYNELKNSSVKISPRFEELALAAINYASYRRKEIYPIIHKNKANHSECIKLPENYYDFRNNVNLNNESLISFSPYINYINSYIYSKAHSDCQEKKGNYNYTLNVLDVIINNIEIETLKNQLLYRAMYNDFKTTTTSCTINKDALEVFKKHCSDEKLVDHIAKLTQDCEQIKDKNRLTNFMLVNSNNKTTDINSLIHNKNSVIYFWSPKIVNAYMLKKRITYLTNRYPNIQFIGIKTNELNENNTTQNIQNQYHLTKDSKGHNFVKSNEQRTILVNQRGIIENSFTYLSSQKLEMQLSSLENN